MGVGDTEPTVNERHPGILDGNPRRVSHAA